MITSLNQSLLVVSGATIAIVAARAYHIVRRMLENRCQYPDCGGLRMSVTYYMEPNPSAPCEFHMGLAYNTYKFMRCKDHGHLRCECRSRYLSPWALEWRKMVHPSHFEKTAEISCLLLEAGIEVSAGSISMDAFHKPALKVEVPMVPTVPMRTSRVR